MEDIGEGEFIASYVFLFREDDFIGVELGTKLLDEPFEDGLIRGLAQVWLEDILSDCLVSVGVKVAGLNGAGLFEDGPFLDAIGDELGALVGVFCLEVSADRPALVQDEAIVVEVGDLAEGLLLEVGGRLVLALHEVDFD